MPSSALSNRPESLTAMLGAGAGDSLLKTLRDVKNQIIGNKSKKRLYLSLGAVPKIVSVLAEVVGGGGGEAAVIVQAAAAVGSFACGVEDGVRAVVEAGAIPVLLSILSHPDEKVVDAGARSLKIIFQSKLALKQDFHQEEVLNFIVSLLNSNNENLNELACSIIAHSCETNMEQKALCDAAIIDKLVYLFDGSSNQKDACLESITAIVRDNVEVASYFACINDSRALTRLMELLQDRSPLTRLLACVCINAVGHASDIYLLYLHIKVKLVIILVELLEEPGRVGDEAPFLLTTLISGNEDLQKQAHCIGAIGKLCDILHRSPLTTKHLQGILLVLSEICSNLEKSRSELISRQVLNLIIDALDHESPDVRVAACYCIRNILRSTKISSAGNLLSEMVVVRLVQLLQDHSVSVQVASLGAICNLSANLTPRRSILFQCGAVTQLVQLSKSMDSTLRLKSIQSLRNLMFLADISDKENFLKELAISNLASLICDSECSIQEQALALVKNLLDGCCSLIKMICSEDNRIINSVMRLLQNSSFPGASIQGMLVLVNIAAGTESAKELVMDLLVPAEADPGSPSLVIKFLQSKDNALRMATLWCIVNLTNPYISGSCRRVERLQGSGIISQLKTMLNDPFLECKIRVRMALEQCIDFQRTTLAV